MSPERMARLAARWVRRYTRDLPAPVAQRRVEEIDADLHDHIAHERRQGTTDRRIALSIASRMVRGVAADASWRAHSTRKDTSTMSRTAYRSTVRVVLVTAAILSVPLLAMLFTDGANWGLGDFVLAAALLGGTGLLLELAARRPAGIAYRLVTAAIGAAAIVFGESDDAPGLVLFGGLLIVGTVALALRTAQRSA